MAYCAGLDVSVKETRVCIVDDAGKIVREARVASEPEALLQVLTNTIYRLKRVGLLIDGLLKGPVAAGVRYPPRAAVFSAPPKFFITSEIALESAWKICASAPPDTRESSSLVSSRVALVSLVLFIRSLH